MGSLLVLIVFSAFNLAQAQTFQYNCHSQNQGWDANVVLNSKELKIPGYKGTLSVFENKGEKGGSGRLKNHLIYSFNKKKSIGLSGTSRPTYYVDPVLLAGGKELGAGEVGGSIIADWQTNDYLRCVAE